MENRNKKSLSYKIQKNPFLLLFIIIIFAVLLFAVINISDAIRENKAQTTIEDTTAIVEDTKQEIISTTEAEAVTSLVEVNKYNKSIVSVDSENTDTQVTVKAVFDSKDALLTAHYADNVNDVQVAPVFCFYTSDGTQLKCPADLKILDDGVTAIYYLSNIDDYKNAVALADEINVDYENILENDFNLYLQHKTEQDTGSTILGTYKETVEAYAKSTQSNYVSNLASGIRNVEITKNDKFVWIDIYYDDITSYTSLNYDFITNFVCFGFAKNGSSYKRDFIITEHDNLNMLRCKFDEYSLKELADETGDTDKTVAEMFSDYTISVWSTDYDTETSLFTIN